jgi:hypothetical protein
MKWLKMGTLCLPGTRAAESIAPIVNSTKQIFKSTNASLSLDKYLVID